MCEIEVYGRCRTLDFCIIEAMAKIGPILKQQMSSQDSLLIWNTLPSTGKSDLSKVLLEERPI